MKFTLYLYAAHRNSKEYEYRLFSIDDMENYGDYVNLYQTIEVEISVPDFETIRKMERDQINANAKRRLDKLV